MTVCNIKTQLKARTIISIIIGPNRTNKTGINLMILKFTIRGMLSIIRCDKKTIQNQKLLEFYFCSEKVKMLIKINV